MMIKDHLTCPTEPRSFNDFFKALDHAQKSYKPAKVVLTF